MFCKLICLCIEGYTCRLPFCTFQEQLAASVVPRDETVSVRLSSLDHQSN